MIHVYLILVSMFVTKHINTDIFMHILIIDSRWVVSYMYKSLSG